MKRFVVAEKGSLKKLTERNHLSSESVDAAKDVREVGCEGADWTKLTSVSRMKRILEVPDVSQTTFFPPFVQLFVSSRNITV